MARDEFDGPADPSSVVREAKAKVKGPAIGLLVTGIFSLLGGVGGNLYQMTTVDAQIDQQIKDFEDKNQNQQQRDEFKSIMDTYRKVVKVLLPVFIGIAAIVALMTIFGAVQMMGLKGRGLAYTSAILSMIPCISGCCLLGLPFGIWAIVTLGNPEVKRGFAYVAGRGPRETADDLDPGFDR
jgi:hypothetical protein